MSTRRLSQHQPENFIPSPNLLDWASHLLKKYPDHKKASGVIPLLWRVQKENNGWISKPALEWVASYLGMPSIRVYEVATFYTMFNLAPVGKHFIQVCTTTPCMLRGSDALVSVCKNKIHAHENHVTEDGLFSWLEVECLGACVNAPMVQINDDYYEDLDADSFSALLVALERGENPKTGSYIQRHASEPVGGTNILSDFQSQNGMPEPVNATVALARGNI